MKKGERIAIFMWNAIEYLYAEYGSAKIGAVKMPLNHMLVKDDVDFRLGDSEPAVVVVDEHFLPWILEMRPQHPCIRDIICVTDNPDTVPSGIHDFHSLLNQASANDPNVQVEPEDLLALMYTGGTTGRSKGVMHTHRSFIGITLGEMIEWDIFRDEVMLVMAPLPHATAFMIPPCLLRGGRVILTKGFDPPEMCQIIQDEKATWTFMVPTMIYVLLDYADRTKYDLSSLRTVIYGAAPMSPDRLRQALTVFGPIFIQVYSQMEIANITAVFTKDEHVEALERYPQRLKSCGRMVTISEVRIVDDKNQDVPLGDVGEIITRGPHMMKGYWQRDEETKETIVDGWLHTADMAWIDKDGFIYVVDRKKDMIISGGMNVYSAEVENILMQHPCISQAAVLGIPDEKWGEAIKGVVVLKKDAKATEDEILAFCRERLSAYKRPKSIDFVDQIPVTPYGKLDKKVLRERYWSGQERGVH
jgi:acyl-CoA synthetase (AMP-forming)/AMP-acid ligase II